MVGEHRSKASSSTAIIAGAISTTVSSGRSCAGGSAKTADLSLSDATAQPVIDAWFRRTRANCRRDDAGPGWGWHVETALHALRMIVGGVSEAHSELQIVIGHVGEPLPFMLQRVDVMTPVPYAPLSPPIAFFYLRLFFQNETFQWVTGDSNKKNPPVSGSALTVSQLLRSLILHAHFRLPDAR